MLVYKENISLWHTDPRLDVPLMKPMQICFVVCRRQLVSHGEGGQHHFTDLRVVARTTKAT